MSWKLMTLLPQLLESEDFTLLRHYLTDDADKRKLFQLSSRAADLFDQYLVYRPDWLTQWEAGQMVDGLGEAQIWQAPLWKALVEYTAELGQPRWHRANVYQRFIQTLEKAITQHRQQLNQWTQKVDIALNSWREKKQRLQAWQTLQKRQSTAALLAENRLDQKKMDEFAQRAAMRKPE
ncbi:MAG: flagellar export protein FliJ, partial [Escherichia coli]|nr:flagellar export protein FliJ [Escherichia coli]